MYRPGPRPPANGRMVAAAVWLALAWSAAVAAADPFIVTNLLRKDFWDADGTVQAIAMGNGVVYIGGSFARVAPQGRRVAAVDVHTGQAQPEFPRIVGDAIHAILDDGEGGWYLGGDFSEAGGLPRTNLVHVLPDNTVDPSFRPDPNGVVWALATDGATLYVGGEFTIVGSSSRSHLAAISRSNNVVTDWAPEPNDRVSCLWVSEDRIYAGGYFTLFRGVAAGRLVALDAATAAVLNWSPQPDGPVLAMSLLGSNLFVGGTFNLIGDHNRSFRNGAAAVDVMSGAITPWNPQLGGPGGGTVTVNALLAGCDGVYLAGDFTQVRGAARAQVAAVDSDDGRLFSWDAGLSLPQPGQNRPLVLGLARAGDVLYLCGDFSIDGDPLRQDLVGVDVHTGRLLPWNPGLDGGISAMAVAGRTVVAGFIRAPGGAERRNLAAFDVQTGKALPWNPGANGAVASLAFFDNTVYAGGDFTEVDGQSHVRLAAIDAGSGLVHGNWNASADGRVLAMAQDGQRLFVGGLFGSLGTLPRPRLGALDLASGEVVTNWFADILGDSVRALALAGTNLFVGGSFSAVQGMDRTNLAALDAVTGRGQPWNPGANGIVRALAVDGQVAYAGGDFTAGGGLPRAHLAAFDAATGLATAWNPGADAEVYSLASAGGLIYVGGSFTHLGGQVRLGLGILEGAGQLIDWNPGESALNRVLALAVTEQALWVGGTGMRFTQAPATHALGAFPSVGAPVLLSEPRDARVLAGQTAVFQVQAGGLSPLTYQWHFNGVAIPGASEALLARTNAQPGDSGIYEVTVRNARGTARAEAVLTVLAPVLITGQPADFVGTPITNVVLAVNATGSPPPIYQWRLNGVNIPGAVFAFLTLTNLGPDGGGSYQVIVANSQGAVNSRVARVLFDSPVLSFQDNFESRGMLAGAGGVGRGDNRAATGQFSAGEPRPAGKRGGRSVWLRWTAPARGIASFDTRGSGFDTILGVYAGDSLANLSEVAADDDRGGYLTSRAVFNAEAGAEYAIAVDGLGGAGGDIVLRWALDTSSTEFPRIVAEPASQTVAPGGTATFTVSATSPTPMSFQWYFGCQAIPGATAPTLAIPNVQRRNVGRYHVVVMNASVRVAESLSAALELGSQSGARTFDKLEDALATLEPGAGFLPAADGLDPLLVAMGNIVSQTFNTSSNTTSLTEPNPCGVFGGHSAWVIFKPAEDGVVSIDTSGSSFDTVLSVYRATNLIALLTNPGGAFVTCDDNGAADGVRSLVRFDALGGAVYLALVDGVADSRGTAIVRWRLGLPPGQTPSASNLTVEVGNDIALHADTAGIVPPPTYQWLFNGVLVPGATNSELVLSMVQLGQAGIYSVVLSNFAGVSTSLVAHLTVNCPYALSRSDAVFGPAGGGGNVVVTTPGGCLWGVSNVPAWIQVTGGHVFQGAGTFDYQVDMHTGQTLRVASLLVAGRPFRVVQSPKDALAPTVEILAPAAGVRTNLALVGLRGGADDNIGVARVEYALGERPFREAAGTTQWHAQVLLDPGTNRLQVRSFDFAGNASITRGRILFHVARSPLHLDYDPAGGSVSGARDGQLLELGRGYTLTAHPAAGFVFSNWTGTGSVPVTDVPRLRFLMQSNLELRANFVPNPFGSLRGPYHGLFAGIDTLDAERAGYVGLNLTARGTYSGQLRAGGRRFPFSGRFALNGMATHRVTRGTNVPLVMELNLPLAATNHLWIHGRVLDAAWVADFRAAAARFNARTQACPFQGRYTLQIPGGEATGTSGWAGGDGIGAVTVRADGVASFVGSLADGTGFSVAAPLSEDGNWPLHAALYGGRGLAWSWLAFETNSAVRDLAGRWRWIRPVQPGGDFVPAQFGGEVEASGSRYRAVFGTAHRWLEFDDGLAQATFRGAGLAESFTNRIRFLPGGGITNLSTNTLSVSVAKISGLFSGRVSVPETGAILAFRGAMMQKWTNACGYFLNTNASGRVKFEAPLP